MGRLIGRAIDGEQIEYTVKRSKRTHLLNKDPAIRLQAIETGDMNINQLARALMTDPVPSIRAACVKQAAKERSKVATSFLKLAYSDGDENVRAAVFLYCASSAPETMVANALMDESPVVRMAVVTHRDLTSLQLSFILNDPDLQVKMAAQQQYFERTSKQKGRFARPFMDRVATTAE